MCSLRGLSIMSLRTGVVGRVCIVGIRGISDCSGSVVSGVSIGVTVVVVDFVVLCVITVFVVFRGTDASIAIAVLFASVDRNASLAIVTVVLRCMMDMRMIGVIHSLVVF